jgi:hypothetical protein
LNGSFAKPVIAKRRIIDDFAAAPKALPRKTEAKQLFETRSARPRDKAARACCIAARGAYNRY